MITYRKTKDGKWVAFGPASEVRVGTITVTKRNGETKSETVANVGRPFKIEGIDHVYGYLEPRAPEVPSLDPMDDRCAECGSPLRGRGKRAYDSSGIPGLICGRCARQTNQYERSFA